MSHQPKLYIKEWRQYRALSQFDLAQLAGMSRFAILRIESGANVARPSSVRKLATALGLQPHELYTPPPELAIAADQSPANELVGDGDGEEGKA
jgi:transcriptional regulator with XRE-family HTH domain